MHSWLELLCQKTHRARRRIRRQARHIICMSLDVFLQRQKLLGAAAVLLLLRKLYDKLNEGLAKKKILVTPV
jgi:hypothetical protein